MISIARKVEFSATHVYRVKEWSDEKNKQVFGLCSNPNGHGHDYLLDVSVKGNVNPSSGIVVNITEIDRVVKKFVAKELDGKFLNREHEYFQTHIPTTENIVTYIWDSLVGKIPDCKLQKITLQENPYLYAVKGEDQMVQLTRKYHFSTAHRLHSHLLSEEENIRLFGKCNNPNGHGHNYYLDVTVFGIPDPVTGMIVNLAELDEIVKKAVLDKFDHKHLNLDTDEFKTLNPTSENVAIVIWNLLSQYLPNLKKIGLWETQKNYFEYYGPEGESSDVFNK